MPYPQFDRSRINYTPLAERINRVEIERDHVSIDMTPAACAGPASDTIAETVARVRAARAAGAPVMLAFGAHTIKNGLAPVIIQLLKGDWITHLATNGAGIIHDWEFAWCGQSSEHVEANMRAGRFGLWEETGYYLNLALNLGAYGGMGYGEAVGAFIRNDGGELPTEKTLVEQIRANAEREPETAAAAADLLAIIRRMGLASGRVEVPHRWKAYSVQAAAYEAKVPFTGHPMIGQDIIYNHPMNHGASIGRAAQRDYLTFADSVSRLAGGVYVSMGSAVMSPMVFEKSMALAQNLALQHGDLMDDHYICVVDLAPSSWDWHQGEPPEDHPEYYHRYNKTFARMGGTMRYLSMNNRDFLLHLAHGLRDRE